MVAAWMNIMVIKENILSSSNFNRQKLCSEPGVGLFSLGVLVFLKFSHFSPERKETGSLDATVSQVWIGNFNVKA